MVLIDGKGYFLSKPITPENAEYNSALLYYINTKFEIEKSQKQLKKYARIIKKLAGE